MPLRALDSGALRDKGCKINPHYFEQCPPPFWGHRDDEALKSAHDVPAPVFKHRRGAVGRAWSAAAALEVAGAG